MSLYNPLKLNLHKPQIDSLLAFYVIRRLIIEIFSFLFISFYLVLGSIFMTNLNKTNYIDPQELMLFLFFKLL